MKNKSRKISASLLLNSLLFSLLLSVCIGAIGFTTYRAGVMLRYQSYLETAIRFVLQNVDPDDLAHCIATGEKSPAYQALQEKLDGFKEASSLQYLYIIQPLNTQAEDNVEYVLTAVRKSEAEQFDKAISLGDLSGKEYTPEVVQNFFTYINTPGISYYPNRTEFGYMYSAVTPIADAEGKPVALAAADISMDEVYETLWRYAGIVLLASLLVTALFLWVQICWTRRRVVRPISGLAAAAEGYVQSNRESNSSGVLQMKLPDIHTGDELELLRRAMERMGLDLNEYITDLAAVTAEKERIGAELDVAKHIQASMLPCIFPAFPERPELDIYAVMTPAKEVGGDFYDFFLVDDDRLAIVMADVSGKGVPAALFMVIAKTLLKNVAQTGLTPQAVLEKVNNQLCVGNEAEMFVTVWLGILEISTGKLTCANAGHEYPVLKRAGGGYELIKDKHGFVLAGLEGSRYKEYELQMNPGDRLFLYTDGVAEATDAHNELYGTGRMLKALNRNQDVNCETLLQRMKEEIDAFAGEAPQFDDITMLSLELRSPEGGMKKIQLSPALAAIEAVTAFVEGELEKAGVAMKIIAQMNIAVDEIFSNIARYSAATSVTVGVGAEKGRITLRFADNGRPYDPTEKPDPDTSLSAEERDAGGLGIFMVKKFMDAVEYEYHDGLNILTLSKKES